MLIVVGGQAWNGDLSSTEKLIMDGTMSAWTTDKPIPVAVHGVAYASLDNKVFMLGRFGC